MTKINKNINEGSLDSLFYILCNQFCFHNIMDTVYLNMPINIWYTSVYGLRY